MMAHRPPKGSHRRQHSQTHQISDASILDRVTQWDPSCAACLAPVSQEGLDSIEILRQAIPDRPLPSDFPGDLLTGGGSESDTVSPPPSVSSVPPSPFHSLDGGGVLPPFASIEGALGQLESGEVRIETAQQFLAWYVDVEREMADEEDAEYRQFLRELQAQLDQCNGLLEEAESCLRMLEELKEMHRSVTEKTDRLHTASENLVVEQTSLSKRVALVEQHLAPFLTAQDLEPRLTASFEAGMATLSMAVQGPSFIPTLQRLDEAITHMVQYPNFQESGVYLVKLRGLQHKALSMIRAYVCYNLRLAAESAYQQRPESLDAAFSAFYGKFRTCAPRLKGLMLEMERRAKPGEDTMQLLSDVYDTYFDFRGRLLRPLLLKRLQELNGSHNRDHCMMVRAGCNTLVRICFDEHELFYQFFNQATESFTTFVLNLGNALYDLLRPIFLKMGHLETLSELCSILRVEMIEEQVNQNREPLQAFETLCLQMLQDVQERLVYVTHIYIRSDILDYNPSQGDLAYPQKLEMMKSIAESLPNGEGGSLGGRSPCDLHGMWYPTVRRTLVCLSKLFRCLDLETFQGLSQEALEMCVTSLLEGSKQISQKIDGHLFLIKHLLILREQIAPFQVEFAVRETALDFRTVKDAAWSLFHKRRMLFALGSNNALLEFLLEGTPQVTDKLSDSRQNVDFQLKSACRDFIELAARDLIGPLLSLLERMDTFLAMDESQQAVLSHQPYGKAEAVQEVVVQSTRLFKAKLPKLLGSLSLYLANRSTEEVLFRPIRAKVVDAFQRLQNILAKYYDEEEIRLVACPSVEQISLLIATVIDKPQAPAQMSPRTPTAQSASAASASSTASRENGPTPTAKRVTESHLRDHKSEHAAHLPLVFTGAENGDARRHNFDDSVSPEHSPSPQTMNNGPSSFPF